MVCQCCVSLAWLGFLLTNYSSDCLQQSLSGSQGLSQDLTGKCLPLKNGVNISRIYIYIIIGFTHQNYTDEAKEIFTFEIF